MVYQKTMKMGSNTLAIAKKLEERKAAKKTVMTNKSLTKAVKKLQTDDELKHYDVYYGGSGQTINTSFLVSCLNVPGVGSLNTQREGQEVRFTSLQFKGELYYSLTPSSTLPIAIRVRNLVLWDRQPNGSLPNIQASTASNTDAVLDNTSITNALYSPFSHDASQRFKILRDHIYTLDPRSIAYNGTNYAVSDFQIKCDHKLKLSRLSKYVNGAGNGTISDLITNSLISVWVADTPSDVVTLYGGYRAYFKG